MRAGVVIGETAIIGQNVRLYHAVTLVAKRFPVDENSSLTKVNEQHPNVENDVVVYTGALRLAVMFGWRVVMPPGSNISQAQMRQEAF